MRLLTIVLALVLSVSASHGWERHERIEKARARLQECANEKLPDMLMYSNESAETAALAIMHQCREDFTFLVGTVMGLRNSKGPEVKAELTDYFNQTKENLRAAITVGRMEYNKQTGEKR